MLLRVGKCACGPLQVCTVWIKVPKPAKQNQRKTRFHSGSCLDMPWFLTDICWNLRYTFNFVWDLGGGFNFFYVQPYLGKWSNLTNIFQIGWNHQLEMYSVDFRLEVFLGTQDSAFSEDQLEGVWFSSFLWWSFRRKQNEQWKLELVV